MSIPKATEFILALLLMVDAAWVADGLLHKRNMWKWIALYWVILAVKNVVGLIEA